MEGEGRCSSSLQRRLWEASLKGCYVSVEIEPADHKLEGQRISPEGVAG